MGKVTKLSHPLSLLLYDRYVFSCDGLSQPRRIINFVLWIVRQLDDCTMFLSRVEVFLYGK